MSTAHGGGDAALAAGKSPVCAARNLWFGAFRDLPGHYAS